MDEARAHHTAIGGAMGIRSPDDRCVQTAQRGIADLQSGSIVGPAMFDVLQIGEARGQQSSDSQIIIILRWHCRTGVVVGYRVG